VTAVQVADEIGCFPRKSAAYRFIPEESCHLINAPKQAIASPSNQTRFEFGSYSVEHLWTYAARLELADYGTFRSTFWYFSNVFKDLVRKMPQHLKDVFAISIR